MRRGYRNHVRLTPGGHVISGEWYRVPLDAPRYLGWLGLQPYSQWLQFKNPWSDAWRLGEVTPPWEREIGFFADSSNYWRPRFVRPWSGSFETITPADGPHGTPAAYAMEPEFGGEYSTRVWLPGQITAGEFAALPECIRDHHPDALDPVCDSWLWEDGEPILWEIGEDAILAENCGDCDSWLWEFGDPILWDDADSILIAPCGDCDDWLWEGGDPILWEESGDTIEVECPE